MEELLLPLSNVQSSEEEPVMYHLLTNTLTTHREDGAVPYRQLREQRGRRAALDRTANQYHVDPKSEL